MQFILIAYDKTDKEALNRRMENRPAHFEKIVENKKAGYFLFGGAMLDESGKMIGSTIVFEVPDRETLDKILLDEPYITGGVWGKIEILPFRLAKVD